MLSRFLALGLSVSLVSLVGTSRPAYAQDDDDEDVGDDEEGAKGGDVEEEEEVDENQPPITAGGLFTMRTYPVREISRPLTMTEKIVQLRLGLGIFPAWITCSIRWLPSIWPRLSRFSAGMS